MALLTKQNNSLRFRASAVKAFSIKKQSNRLPVKGLYVVVSGAL
jgi:hypothetical protein